MLSTFDLFQIDRDNMEQLGRQENSREVGDDDDDDDDSWLSHLDEIFEDTSGTNGQHVNKPPKSIEILYPVPDTPKITSLMPATPLHHRHYGLSAPTVCRPQESYRQDHKVNLALENALFNCTDIANDAFMSSTSFVSSRGLYENGMSDFFFRTPTTVTFPKLPGSFMDGSVTKIPYVPSASNVMKVSTDTASASNKRRPIKKKKKKRFTQFFFPFSLHTMLDHIADSNNKDGRSPLSSGIAWLEDGSGFKIINPKLFAQDTLPEYFDTLKYKSFVRQINIYSFRRQTEVSKSDPAFGAYFHPNFKRGEPDLCWQMKRQKVKGNGSPRNKKEGEHSPVVVPMPASSGME